MGSQKKKPIIEPCPECKKLSFHHYKSLGGKRVQEEYRRKCIFWKCFECGYTDSSLKSKEVEDDNKV